MRPTFRACSVFSGPTMTRPPSRVASWSISGIRATYDDDITMTMMIFRMMMMTVMILMMMMILVMMMMILMMVMMMMSMMMMYTCLVPPPFGHHGNIEAQQEGQILGGHLHLLTDYLVAVCY